MARLLVALLICGGCSFGLSSPKRPSTIVAPTCDTSRSRIALDAVGAGVFGLATYGMTQTDEPALALLPGVVAAIYGAAILYGDSKVNECRRAIADYQTAYARQP